MKQTVIPEMLPEILRTTWQSKIKPTQFEGLDVWFTILPTNNGLASSGKRQIRKPCAPLASTMLFSMYTMVQFLHWITDWLYMTLKAVDTPGNCQSLAFTLGVSHHMHKITNLWKFHLNWSSKLRDNNERTNTLVTRSCVLSDAWFRDLKF